MRIERWPRILMLRLRSIVRRGEVEHELDEELRDHLSNLVAQNEARGLSPTEAKRQALITMGGFEQHKEESRQARGISVAEHLVRDVKLALRALGRAPAYAAVVILTLALGIGANAAIFTVVNAVLLRPLDYREPDRLVVVNYRGESTVAPGTFMDWQEGQHSFERMAVAEYWMPGLTGTDKPEQLVGLHVSADMFSLLGIQPMMGRTFNDDEGHAGRGHVVVLSYQIWNGRFGADPHILDRSLILDGESYKVVGVMPQQFGFAPFWATNARLWVPLMLDESRNDRDRSSLRAFARLKPGVTLGSAQADLDNVNANLAAKFPGPTRRLVAVPLQERVTGDIRGKLLILLAAVGFVLLIACANVAHLQLMRAAAREREFGVRTALGATRQRLAQQSLVESGVVSFAGAALGLVLAYAGVRALVALAPPDIPRLNTISMDGHVLAYLASAALGAAALFGFAPAVVAARGNLENLIRDGGRAGSEGAGRRRARGFLVASEFALALVLLVGAGLVVRSFTALTAVNPGFDASNVLSMVVSVKGTTSSEPTARAQFFRELVNRVGALPGVEAASAINHLPLHGDNWHFSFNVEGTPNSPGIPRPRALFRVVRPGYFETMHIPVVRGRAFTAAEEENGAKSVIVSEYMAQHQWPGQDPIGRRISVDDANEHPDWFTVVGVAKNVKQEDMVSPDADEMYYPSIRYRPEMHDATGSRPHSLITELNPESMTLVLRTRPDAPNLAVAVQKTVWDMQRDAPVSDVMTMQQAVGEHSSTPRFYALLMSAFGTVALALAAIGIYGVISYSVSRRTREIGIRIALGAGAERAFMLVMGEGLTLAAIGGAVGLLASFALTRFLRALLFGVTPSDPATFAVVVAVLAAAALVACAVPARRAAKVDPMAALRGE